MTIYEVMGYDIEQIHMMQKRFQSRKTYECVIHFGAKITR